MMDRVYDLLCIEELIQLCVRRNLHGRYQLAIERKIC